MESEQLLGIISSVFVFMFTGVENPATRTLECKLHNPSTSAKPVMTKLQNLFVACAKAWVSFR